MSANPYDEDVAAYMAKACSRYSDTTRKERTRRYARIKTDMEYLKREGKIKTYAPAKISPDAVKEFINYRVSKDVTPTDVSHDISALAFLCRFRGNVAVDQCLAENPGIKPVNHQRRLPPLSEEIVIKILSRWKTISFADFPMVRAYAMVILYIGCGARNMELRLATKDDLDTELWQIHLENVKGGKTYGAPRDVPILDPFVPVVQAYLAGREQWLLEHKTADDSVVPLFFKLGGDYGFLSGNGIRRIKGIVEQDLGVTFEIRDCRRAFGQMFLDGGLSFEDIAVLMGHIDSSTTRKYYAGRTNEDAIKSARENPMKLPALQAAETPALDVKVAKVPVE